MLLADRSYNADAVRAEITFTGTRAVIPAKRSRSMFNKLKNWRRIATRYDKIATSYQGFVSIAATFRWISSVHGR